MESFEQSSRPYLIFGEGSLDRLGEVARAEGFSRTLLTADAGLVHTGYVQRAINLLATSGITAYVFSEFGENPDSDMIERGCAIAKNRDIDSFVGLGGGSSLDCAKGINFVLTNGGTIQDYWGYGKASIPLLPMIGIPTTSGTGSEAQSYALISDSENHIKMACGDPTGTFRIAILDPVLTITQPHLVTAATGFDSLAHAVETYVTNARNPISEMYSREAFRLLQLNFHKVLQEPKDMDARAAMQLGAYFAGTAIENSMLGATHACANPLTQAFGITHGRAIALFLPHVVRFNNSVVASRYADLLNYGGIDVNTNPGETLATFLESLATLAQLPRRLQDEGIPRNSLVELSKQASTQWTASFNPRPFNQEAALEIYHCAY